IAVLAVRREDLHAGSGRNLDPRFFRVGVAVEYVDVILTSDGDPDLTTIRREECLVRRASHIGRVLHGIGGGVDEGHRIAADRYDRQRPVIREYPIPCTSSCPL